MYFTRLSQVFVVAALLVLMSNLAQAILWKSNFSEGSTSAQSDSLALKKTTLFFAGSTTVPLRFNEFKNKLDLVAQSRSPASEKVHEFRQLLSDFSMERKKMGFSSVSHEIEMDLFVKSVQFWVNDPHFSIAKCATYKHQLLMRFEPEAELSPNVAPLDHSFQVLEKTCHSS